MYFKYGVQVRMHYSIKKFRALPKEMNQFFKVLLLPKSCLLMNIFCSKSPFDVQKAACIAQDRQSKKTPKGHV